MSDEWPDDDARFTGPGCPLDKIGGVASGRAFKPEAFKPDTPKPRQKEVKMKNVRELVGALTQARVQMLAAKAIIEEAVNGMTADRPNELTALTSGVMDPKDVPEASALAFDAKKLERCMGVVEDVRERYSKPNEPLKES